MFQLPPDLDLAEYSSPFETPEDLAIFILDCDNNTAAFKLLRTHIMNFAATPSSAFPDWTTIAHEVIQYPNLPQTSLLVHGLYPVFQAAVVLLKSYDDS